MYRTAARLVAALCLAFAVCLGQGIITGPDNDAQYAGAQATLNCYASPGDRVMWYEYATGSPGGALISDGADLSPTHPNYARYIMDADVAAGTYHLTIIDLVVGDGGEYECWDENTKTFLASNLVVLAQAPNCTTTLPSGGIVVEGIHYTIECTVFFQATDGIFPLISWTGPGDFNVLDVNNPGVVKSGIGFDVQKVMDAKQFRATTNFTQAGFGGPNMATNIPTFTHVYTSMTLFVRYGPQNVSIVPMKPSYEIGDVLTCFSDAVPLPTYVWTDMQNNLDYVSQTLTIVDMMAGNAILRCQITNVVGSANIFLNTTVNPRTTPTTPTTTPTTTPVPAVSNCLDLTGRWEYQRGVGSKAVLCMYVNTAANGYITGLFMNDTYDDTIYMQIVGRTRNKIYDETGLVAIWPFNAAVSAFALECHRCYGVETLLVNVVSRTPSDDLTCGDGGAIAKSEQYPFTRVDWAYPCGPLTTKQELKAVSLEAAAKRQKRFAEANGRQF